MPSDVPRACRALASVTLLALALGGCERSDMDRLVRGAWIAEYGGRDFDSPEGQRALERMRALGASWIAVGPEVELPGIDRPDLSYGKRDAYYRRWIRRARGLGLQVMLLPRLESPAFFEPPFPFRADIEMRSPADWQRFFDAYEAMLLHYARMAREEGVGLLGVGLEYRKAVRADPDRWRRMIAAVRKVYRGRLTYSANWWKELDEVPFWDALDYVGIGAYFEVARNARASGGELDAGWKPVTRQLEELSRRVGRPILFTETGYPGYADAGKYPWKWQFDTTRTLDPGQQAACYEALFRNLATKKWFAGLFIWRFYTVGDAVPAWEYTPEGRPAQRVVHRWFHRRAL